MTDQLTEEEINLLTALSKPKYTFQETYDYVAAKARKELHNNSFTEIFLKRMRDTSGKIIDKETP